MASVMPGPSQQLQELHPPFMDVTQEAVNQGPGLNLGPLAVAQLRPLSVAAIQSQPHSPRALT